MSKRCKLQKEYHKANGNYKGKGKYSDHYVKWLEEQVLKLRMREGKLPEDYLNENRDDYGNTK